MTFIDEWLATRPECVQELAKEFPLGSMLEYEGKTLHLIGYTERDGLILSPVDPYVNYHGATEQRIYCCAEHFR